MYLCIKLFSVSVCLSLLSIKLSTTHLHHPPLSPCLSMYVSLLLSVSLCIFLSVCFYLFVSVSPCLSLSPFMSLSLCLSMFLSASLCLYLSISVCVSVCQPFGSSLFTAHYKPVHNAGVHPTLCRLTPRSVSSNPDCAAFPAPQLRSSRMQSYSLSLPKLPTYERRDSAWAPLFRASSLRLAGRAYGRQHGSFTGLWSLRRSEKTITVNSHRLVFTG